jgi:hypothetical protein
MNKLAILQDATKYAITTDDTFFHVTDWNHSYNIGFINEPIQDLLWALEYCENKLDSGLWAE